MKSALSPGMQKPPLAPKPKLNQPQRSELSPSTPRRDGLSPHTSPGTPNRAKPALAPKPCLSKLSAAAAPDSYSLSPKSPRQFTSVVEKSDVPKNIGLQNSKNGIQQENKKPDWDYIIPICLCTHENCQCMGNAADKISGKSEKDLKKWPKSKAEESGKSFPRSQFRVDNRGEKMDGVGVSQVTNGNLLTDIVLQSTIHTYCPNNNAVPNTPVQNKQIENKNLKSHTDASGPVATARPSLPLRTWSDEANGNVLPPSVVVGPGPGEGSISSDRASASPHASPPKKTLPVPSPRKPRKAALARQEKALDEDEPGGGGGEEMSAREVKVSGERKSSLSSLSVNVVRVPAQGSTAVGKNEQTSRKACPPPAPPPRKKPFLSTPETRRTPSSAPCSPSRDAAGEENLGWNDGVYEMECSVDGEEDAARAEEGRTDERRAFSDDVVAHFPPSIGPRNQPELSRHPATGLGIGDGLLSEGNGAVKIAPKKPQRHSAHMAWMLDKDPSGDILSPDVEKRLDLTVHDGAPRDARTRELPLLPPEMTTKRSLFPALASPGRQSKAPRSVLGKQRAKSFSSADLIHAEVGQKKNSLRRLLDLKLSVKMLPKLRAKGGGQTPESCAAAETEQCVDGDRGSQEHLDARPSWRAPRKFSCPQIGYEQNVDGEFCAGVEQCVDYENSPHYEEITYYVNLPPPAGRAATSRQALQTTARQNDDDENVYEEQEPYMLPLQKHTEHQQKHSGSDRGSVDEEEEEVAVDHDASWGDDEDVIMAHSSDEEEEDDDSSTSSSKGDPAHREEEQREAESGPKKSKIHHIATEIMSSEKVFVDVLKLLHIDFRDAVAKASRQSGKTVIEERVLNQILYNLPQLYELNQDLLRELEQRVAKWDESARLADIFVKKGPYLKMYSTYIREFDKNVTQLEEQTKRNSVFAGVLREFEASPRCANLALRHYLLKPIQRIPQYQMLLTDYLKNLSPDSLDYKDTQAALGIVKEVANHANDIMKQGDNFQKLIQVQCRLNGHHEIVQPGRVFLKEGILMKLSRKVMQPRTFFLFNDALLYTTPVQSGQVKLNNMLSLAGMKVSKPNQEAYQNELNIESVERSFILSASSATERDEWLEAISMAINDYTRKKITFISGKAPEEIEPSDSASLGSIAPIWIPDLRATMCMICTCEFTLTWRRHHCRACGKVVCQACSSNKYYLEYLKNQLARVCDQCFTVLQQKRSEQAQAMALSPGAGSKSAFAFTRKQKKIPAALKEVTANTDNSSMSGYLQRSKGNKRQVKRLWFVIKDKVLYTYAASEDVAALESQPLLGFMLKEDSSQKLQFKLYHKNTLYYIFKADDIQTAQRWIDSFKEAAVL